MAYVSLFDLDVTAIDNALPFIAGLVPNTNTVNPTTAAQYGQSPYVGLTGSGFVYDAAGHLAGGTITGMTYGDLAVSNGAASTAGDSVQITGLSVSVATLDALYASGQSAVPTLLAGNNAYYTQAYNVTGSTGNDVINVIGPQIQYSFYLGSGGLPAAGTTVNVNGEGGQNTVAFGQNLRSAATMTAGGGGTESLQLSGQASGAALTSNLVNTDALTFFDGSTYETNASVGAQAALEFEGIFGRLPDAINAGGYALVAQQSGTFAAATQMMTTQEGGGDTNGLSNADFVARLYQNMLHRAPDAAGQAVYQGDLDSGTFTRGGVAAQFAASLEAQSANFTALASGSVFAADPNAVEVVRAYETLLDRLPEQAALVGDTQQLNGGMSLQQLYTGVQGSQEFASLGPNPYGITSATAYGSVFSTAHTDPVNSTIAPYITSGGIAHL